MSFKELATRVLKFKISDSSDKPSTFNITEDDATFQKAIKNGDIEGVLIQIANGVNINQPINTSKDGRHPNEKYAIEIVCSEGYWQILDMLLKHISLKDDLEKCDPLLCIVGKNLTKDTIKETKSNFRLCFKRLLEDERIDINLADDYGNTPLHYTVEYKCDELTKLLLERGAYIGIKNLKAKLPIDGIDIHILRNFFDSRMTSNYNLHNRICNDFEINLDYSFLIKNPSKSINKYSEDTDQFYPIEFISQSEELKELISHPLIRYLIWMKTEALSKLFIWNRVLVLVLFLTLVHITFFNMGPNATFIDQHIFIYTLTRLTTWFCLIILSFHLIMQTPVVIKNFSITSYEIWRFLNELCIVLLLLIIFKFKVYTVAPITSLDRQATALCIILIAVDMNLLMITIPKCQNLSVHFLMLQKILRQFLIVFSFYLIILFAFSIAFYVLEIKDIEHQVNKVSIPANTTIINNFYELGIKFIQVIGMMIGELNLEFESKLTVYYLLILLFIFLITIVLVNLLNGLAVCDVGEIRLKAELIYLVSRVQLIIGYEKYFLKHVFIQKFIFNMARYRKSLNCIKNLKLTLHKYVRDVKIYSNRNLTIVNGNSKSIDLDDAAEPFNWPHVNANIVNQLVEHFKNKLQEQRILAKENHLQIMLKEINQKLDSLQLQQTTRHTIPSTMRDVRLDMTANHYLE